jgi:hypothetical protein
LFAYEHQFGVAAPEITIKVMKLNECSESVFLEQVFGGFDSFLSTVFKHIWHHIPRVTNRRTSVGRWSVGQAEVKLTVEVSVYVIYTCTLRGTILFCGPFDEGEGTDEDDDGCYVLDIADS